MPQLDDLFQLPGRLKANHFADLGDIRDPPLHVLEERSHATPEYWIAMDGNTGRSEAATAEKAVPFPCAVLGPDTRSSLTR